MKMCMAGTLPVREQMDPVKWTTEAVEEERTRMREEHAITGRMEHTTHLEEMEKTVTDQLDPADYSKVLNPMPLPSAEERKRGPRQSDVAHGFERYGMSRVELEDWKL